LTKSFSAILFILLILSFTGAAQASVPKPLELNKWYDISTPALPFDRAKATGMLKDVAGGYTYIDVFRVKLEIGETYTFQSEYPGDHQFAVVSVRGVNPFSRRKYISNPLGTTFLAVSDDRSFPGGNIKGITFGSRSNFTVSPKSKHSFAFIAIAGYKPNISMKVRMIHPALPNDMIKKEGDYRIKPDGSKSHYGPMLKRHPSGSAVPMEHLNSPLNGRLIPNKPVSMSQVSGKQNGGI